MVREREIGGENGREDGGGGKRRKVDDGITDGSGGGGGFQAEDAALGGSGGFLPDDSDVNMDDDQTTGGGGFFTSDNDNDGPPPPPIKASSSKVFSRTTPAHLLPLSFLPSTMSLLSLAVDDDVLAVFESTGFQSIDSEMTGVYGHREFPAEGEGQGEEGFGVGEGIKGYTTLRDFRAVCAAMIEPEPESEFEGRDGQEMDTDEPMNGMDMDQDEDDEEDSQDAYKEDDTSSLSSLDSEGDEAAYNPNPSTAANNKSRRRQRNLPPIEDDLILPSQSQQPKKPRLSPEQKQNITRLWNLMFQNTPAGILAAQTGRGGERYLGKEQVRRWAEIMGEVWTEQEVGAMQLFDFLQRDDALGWKGG